MFYLARLQIADGNHAGNLFGQDWRGGHQQLDSSCSSRPFIFDFNFDRDGFTTMEHLIAIFVTDDGPEYHRRRLDPRESAPDAAAADGDATAWDPSALRA